jgi:hypothetical protein
MLTKEKYTQFICYNQHAVSGMREYSGLRANSPRVNTSSRRRTFFTIRDCSHKKLLSFVIHFCLYKYISMQLLFFLFPDKNSLCLEGR